MTSKSKVIPERVEKSGQRRKLKGRVVSDVADKTITVLVERLKIHPLYQKKFKSSKKFLVDDPKNSYKIGDRVEIEETIPLSKRKSFQVIKKIK